MEPASPFPLLATWWQDVLACDAIVEKHAACLATATLQAKPSARMVLVKSIGDGEFVFFSNLQSRKGHELTANAHVALCFYWQPLGRQLRVEGRATAVSGEEADAYFASRPRGSQIGAWASQQSQRLASAETLRNDVAATEARFSEGNLPRPAHWSGWKVEVTSLEFWQEQPFRLHRRQLFTRQGNTWQEQLLYP